MSLTPPPPVTRRDWTLPIIAGVVAIVVLLAVCAVGSTVAYLALRDSPETPPATSAPSPSPSAAPAPPPAKTGPDCLIGDWVETSHSSWVSLFGTRVQLAGKGSLRRLGADGVMTLLLENVVRTGTANSNNYEVIHQGKIQTNYVADETTISWSNPKAEGTTTWKVNGKVRDTENMSVLIDQSTYKCAGNELRIFGKESATEWQRILPPGTPV